MPTPFTICQVFQPKMYLNSQLILTKQKLLNLHVPGVET